MQWKRPDVGPGGPALRFDRALMFNTMRWFCGRANAAPAIATARCARPLAGIGKVDIVVDLPRDILLWSPTPRRQRRSAGSARLYHGAVARQYRVLLIPQASVPPMTARGATSTAPALR